MVFTALKDAEEKAFDVLDEKELSRELEDEPKFDDVQEKPELRQIKQVLTSLPVNKHNVLEPRFFRYYSAPWFNFFYDLRDPYNDLVTIVYGPRGGGKTITGVSLSIIDGQMRGIPCISNVPFSWVAQDTNKHYFKVESIPFDQELFARGDPSLKYKRLLIDEGNYLADRMRSTSNKNLAMTDILQQARKFRMCVVFCTINWMWLDPRLTGSLCDLLIECNDLYYKNFGKKRRLKKGYRIAWDITDQSGKVSGRQFHEICKTTFNARALWHTYNTENFVDPREARKKLMADQKMIVDEFGNEITEASWKEQIRKNLHRLAQSQDEWDSNDLWQALGIEERGLRVKAGQFMNGTLGISKLKDREGYSRYDLSALTV